MVESLSKSEMSAEIDEWRILCGDQEICRAK